MLRRRTTLIATFVAVLVATFVVIVVASTVAGPSSAAVRGSTAARPYVSRLSRRGASTLGGTRLAVRGRNFAGARAVWFGGRRGAGLRVVSSRRLVVRTPPHPAGKFRIRVVTAAGSSPAKSGPRFRFTSPRVVLDPGHNGENASHPRRINRLVPAGYGRRKACNTTGTATDSGYPEYAFNWNVARRARALLRGDFVKVIMTRPNDSGVGPCVNVRARIESTSGVSAAVAIHADGAPSSGHGFHVNEDSRRPVGATRATVRRSTRLGVALHNALARASGLTPSNYIGSHGYVRRDDLAGLNLSTNPTSFLELGNMRNAHDARLQRSAHGRQRIAAAVVAGILSYLRR
jgi:N-acetylmuramoyl-L-alanine amidase